MSPQTSSRRYTNTHLKWFMGTLVFSTLHCRDFSFFYFLFFFFLRVHKKVNKRISIFFPLRCFLSAFLVVVRLFALCAFAWLRFCAFQRFFVLFCACEIFSQKNKKKFETAQIASFILLVMLHHLLRLLKFLILIEDSSTSLRLLKVLIFKNDSITFL